MELKLTKTVPSLGVGFPDGEGPSLNSYSGITTAAGNAAGTTLVDDGLTALPSKAGLLVWIISGAARNQARVIVAHAGNTLTLDAAVAGQIVAGVSYIVLPIYMPLASLVLDIDVPVVDVPDNVLVRDVVGNKGDTPVIVLGVVSSLMAYLKGALAQVNYLVANLLTSANVQTADEAAIVSQMVTSSIVYTPGLQTTGDLEAGTKVINRTAENAVPDYSANLTLPMPADARLVIDVIQARLNIHLDSFITATHLYCSVYVGTDNDAAHRLFTAVDIGVAGVANDNFFVAKMNATLLALLADGAAHTYYFHFWVNAVTSATISAVQAWIGIGDTKTNYAITSFMHLNYKGYIGVMIDESKVGAGGTTLNLIPDVNMATINKSIMTSIDGDGDYAFLPICAVNNPYFSQWYFGTATTMAVVNHVVLTLGK